MNKIDEIKFSSQLIRIKKFEWKKFEEIRAVSCLIIRTQVIIHNYTHLADINPIN